MIAIIDSGGANIASVRFALERLGVAGELTADPAIIASAERVILPGVGAAPVAMAQLAARRQKRPRRTVPRGCKVHAEAHIQQVKAASEVGNTPPHDCEHNCQTKRAKRGPCGLPAQPPRRHPCATPRDRMRARESTWDVGDGGARTRVRLI